MKKSAIVIDDDKDHALLLSEIIENLRISVLGIGHDGNQAVELFEKYRPNYVFLDIKMPELDGLDAMEKIKKIDSNAKIVAVTADLSEETQKKLDDLRIPVIYKPYDISIIEKFL